VFFGADAPDELLEFSIIHDGKTLKEDVQPGDWFQLDQNRYRVLAVGEVANKNLSALGHIIVKFNGQNVPEMPGDICVEERPLPPILVGMRVQIMSHT